MFNFDKTLEQLDKKNVGQPTYDSYLVTTIHQLRKKPLKNFTVEDLRIVIGQNINLEILIPIAIKRLKENILAEGDFYPGDLLKQVLESDFDFWKSHREEWLTVKRLYSENLQLLERDDSFKQIRISFERFENI